MNLNRYLRYGILAGLFLGIPFIPLIVNGNFFFPFIAPKNFAFRILVELMLGAWVVLAIRDISYRPRFSWILAALSVFVSVLALADIFGVNFGRSFWSNFERMEGLITHLHLFAYFLIAASVLNTERLWERFFQTSIGVSAVVCGYGLLQVWGLIKINQGGVRVDATFGNATYLAIYLLFNIFLTVFLLLRHRGHRVLQWLYAAALLFQFLILYYTASRGVILGLVGGVIVTTLLIAFFERENRHIRKIGIGTLIGLVVVSGLFLAVRKTDFVQHNNVLSRFASFSILDEIKTRTYVWNMGLKGFREHPVLGWGQENFNVVFNANYDPRMYAKEQWFDRTHNVILDWLVAGGLLGLLAYLSLLAALLYTLWRKTPNRTFTERALFTGLFAGYFFQNLFIFDNITSYILFFSLLSYFHFQASEGGGEKVAPVERGARFYQVLLPVALVVTLILLYVVNGKPVLANLALIDAMRSQKSGLSTNLDYFKKALAYNTFGTPEIREHLALTAARFTALGTSVDLKTKQDFYNLAREELFKQTEVAPNDARVMMFTGALLDSFGDYAQAIKYLERALVLSPNKQSILSELGTVYLHLRDYPKALQVLRQSHEIEPEFSDARLMYAVGAIYAGRMDLVEKLLVPAYGTIAVPDNRLIKAYLDTKRYSNLIDIWKEQVKRNPNDAQQRLSLAASYLLAGERNKAIAEIQEVINKFPEFKQQGEYFISEIRAGRNP